MVKIVTSGLAQLKKNDQDTAGNHFNLRQKKSTFQDITFDITS